MYQNSKVYAETTQAFSKSCGMASRFRMSLSRMLHFTTNSKTLKDHKRTRKDPTEICFNPRLHRRTRKEADQQLEHRLGSHIEEATAIAKSTITCKRVGQSIVELNAATTIVGRPKCDHQTLIMDRESRDDNEKKRQDESLPARNTNTDYSSADPYVLTLSTSPLGNIQTPDLVKPGPNSDKSCELGHFFSDSSKDLTSDSSEFEFKMKGNPSYTRVCDNTPRCLSQEDMSPSCAQFNDTTNNTGCIRLNMSPLLRSPERSTSRNCILFREPEYGSQFYRSSDRINLTPTSHLQLDSHEMKPVDGYNNEIGCVNDYNNEIGCVNDYNNEIGCVNDYSNEIRPINYYGSHRGTQDRKQKKCGHPSSCQSVVTTKENERTPTQRNLDQNVMSRGSAEVDENSLTKNSRRSAFPVFNALHSRIKRRFLSATFAGHPWMGIRPVRSRCCVHEKRVENLRFGQLNVHEKADGFMSGPQDTDRCSGEPHEFSPCVNQSLEFGPSANQPPEFGVGFRQTHKSGRDSNQPQEARYRSSEPQETDPSGCQLQETDPSGCQLQETDSSGCQLQETDPSGCQLQETDPSVCQLQDTDPSVCQLQETSCSSSGQQDTDSNCCEPHAAESYKTDRSSFEPQSTKSHEDDRSSYQSWTAESTETTCSSYQPRATESPEADNERGDLQVACTTNDNPQGNNPCSSLGDHVGLIPKSVITMTVRQNPNLEVRAAYKSDLAITAKCSNMHAEAPQHEQIMSVIERANNIDQCSSTKYLPISDSSTTRNPPQLKHIRSSPRQEDVCCHESKSSISRYEHTHIFQKHWTYEQNPEMNQDCSLEVTFSDKGERGVEHQVLALSPNEDMETMCVCCPSKQGNYPGTDGKLNKWKSAVLPPVIEELSPSDEQSKKLTAAAKEEPRRQMAGREFEAKHSFDLPSPQTRNEGHFQLPSPQTRNEGHFQLPSPQTRNEGHFQQPSHQTRNEGHFQLPSPQTRNREGHDKQVLPADRDCEQRKHLSYSENHTGDHHWSILEPSEGSYPNNESSAFNEETPNLSVDGKNSDLMLLVCSDSKSISLGSQSLDLAIEIVDGEAQSTVSDVTLSNKGSTQYFTIHEDERFFDAIEGDCSEDTTADCVKMANARRHARNVNKSAAVAESVTNYRAHRINNQNVCMTFDTNRGMTNPTSANAASRQVKAAFRFASCGENKINPAKLPKYAPTKDAKNNSNFRGNPINYPDSRQSQKKEEIARSRPQETPEVSNLHEQRSHGPATMTTSVIVSDRGVDNDGKKTEDKMRTDANDVFSSCIELSKG